MILDRILTTVIYLIIYLQTLCYYMLNKSLKHQKIHKKYLIRINLIKQVQSYIKTQKSQIKVNLIRKMQILWS